MRRKTTLYLDFINHIGQEEYELEGYLGGKKADLEDVTLRVNNKTISLIEVTRVQSQDGLSFHEPVTNSTFRAQFKINISENTSINAEHRGNKIMIRANRFTGLSNLLVSYKNYGKTIWVLAGGGIKLYPKSTLRLVWLEITVNLCILTNWRIISAAQKFIFYSRSARAKTTLAINFIGTIVESILTIPEAIALRLAYFIVKPRLKRRIWVISDRPMAAGDNGEVLFKYISQQKNSPVPADVFFALSKKSPDYHRISKLGRVLNCGGLKYKLYFLLADKIISSHADVEVTNPFLRQIDRYIDLFNFKFVFLQHGIIRHDLSGWLNRFNRNIDLFVTSSALEKKSILLNPYYYQEANVILTGLPRFDLLKSEPKNKLILMPTYRNFLVKGRTNKNGERKYNPLFKKSQYFNFYNQFMNDSDLIRVLEENNMQGELYIHPIFVAQIDDFYPNTAFQAINYPYNYATAFREGSLLVSDYSSVTFDFAYLNKPVLYAHFDAEEFYSRHSSAKSEFFDDEKDGFGPVCSTYESLIEETIKLIKSGSKMSDKYKKRVEKYFEYTDQRNSERVYHAILKLDKDSKA